MVRRRVHACEDTRSKVLSDTNREDEEKYIACIAGQMERVSMETNDIVDALPAEFTAG